jgi:hypothetical protein
MSRRMTSEGRIVAGGLAPDRYDEDTKVAMRDNRRVSVVFTPDSVTLGNGQQRERLPGVQDTASQFIQFTWMFGTQPERLRVGNTFEFPVALPRSMNSGLRRRRGGGAAHGVGPLATFHLKPRRESPRPANGWSRCGSRPSCASCRCASASSRTRHLRRPADRAEARDRRLVNRHHCCRRRHTGAPDELRMHPHRRRAARASAAPA